MAAKIQRRIWWTPPDAFGHFMGSSACQHKAADERQEWLESRHSAERRFR
jgi:hypothetical protein